jgi:dephospho-CoA kinase
MASFRARGDNQYHGFLKNDAIIFRCKQLRSSLIGITAIWLREEQLYQFILHQGYRVLFADTIAKQKLDDPDVKAILAKRWGDGILSDGAISHHKIAEIVFKQDHEREYLNSLIHPLVLQDFQDIVATSQEQYLIFEIPLLFEAGLQACFDFICLITASEETRIQRLKERNPHDLDNQIRRLKAQLPESQKLALADLVIDNSGSLSELEARARNFVP